MTGLPSLNKRLMKTFTKRISAHTLCSSIQKLWSDHWLPGGRQLFFICAGLPERDDFRTPAAKCHASWSIWRTNRTEKRTGVWTASVHGLWNCRIEGMVFEKAACWIRLSRSPKSVTCTSPFMKWISGSSWTGCTVSYENVKRIHSWNDFAYMQVWHKRHWQKRPGFRFGRFSSTNSGKKISAKPPGSLCNSLLLLWTAVWRTSWTAPPRSSILQNDIIALIDENVSKTGRRNNTRFRIHPLWFFLNCRGWCIVSGGYADLLSVWFFCIIIPDK